MGTGVGVGFLDGFEGWASGGAELSDSGGFFIRERIDGEGGFGDRDKREKSKRKEREKKTGGARKKLHEIIITRKIEEGGMV